MASYDGGRVDALSLQLVEAHDQLRRQMSEIRSGLGHRRLSDDALVTHCLAFCAALTTHHRGEDEDMFAQLLQERPDLAPTVTNLVEDHEMIASILFRVSDLAGRASRSDGQILESIGRELDGLAAIMESHFSYEERTISQVLDDGVPDTGWSATVFRFGKA